jgi:hypothetical protein
VERLARRAQDRVHVERGEHREDDARPEAVARARGERSRAPARRKARNGIAGTRTDPSA